MGEPKSFWVVRYIRFLWFAIFIFGVLLLVARIATGILSAEHLTRHLIEVSVLLFLFYLLFVLEGLGAAAMQLATRDFRVLDRYLVKSVAANKLGSLRTLARTFSDQFPDFTTGKHMLAAILVVLIAFVAGEMQYNTPDMRMDIWSSAAAIVRMTEFLYDPITTIVVVVLVPCWLCQLLPHLLAEKRAVQFIQLWPSSALVSICLRISAMELGAPANKILGYIHAYGILDKAEEIPPGEEEIYKGLQSQLGYSVERHSIAMAIEPAATSVSDESEYLFSGGETSRFTHIVRIKTEPSRELKNVTWDTRLPTGVDVAAPNPSSLIERIDRADQGHQAINPSPRSIEAILVNETILSDALPRRGKHRETIFVTASFHLAAFETGEHRNQYVFAITRPTKALILTLRAAADLIIATPDLYFSESDDLQFGGEFRVKIPVPIKKERIENGWLYAVDFPPLHTRGVINFGLKRKLIQS